MPRLTTQKSLFMTVRNDLAAKILSGVYPVGSQLPGVAEMTRHYRVGYCTVTKAIQALRAEGLLNCRRGRNPEVCAISGCVKRIIGILVDNGRPDLPPFDYENSPTIWLLVNKLQSAALALHRPTVLFAPDHSYVNYLPELAGLIMIRSVAGPRLVTVPPALPTVAIYRDGTPAEPEPNTVTAPAAASMHRALTYLLAQGVRQVVFAYLGNVQTEESFLIPECRKFLSERGFPEDAVLTVRTENLFTADGERCFEEAIRPRLKLPCGILAGGDLVAHGMVHAGLHAGLVPKKDFFVLGTSGLPDAGKWSPPLSNLAPDFDSMAPAAVNMLEKIIEMPGLRLPEIAKPYSLTIRGT